MADAKSKTKKKVETSLEVETPDEEKIIQKIVFDKNYVPLDKIDKEFFSYLSKNEGGLKMVILGLGASLWIFLFFVALNFTANFAHLALMLTTSTLVSAGTAIQLGTIFHQNVSKKLNVRIDGITTMVRTIHERTYDMDYIISTVVRKGDIKALEEIQYEYNINHATKNLSKQELIVLIGLLSKNEQIAAPKSKIMVVEVDLPQGDLKEHIHKSLLGKALRIGNSAGGHRSLIYVEQEFTPERIKKFKKDFSQVSKLDLKPLMSSHEIFTKEMNKLGISYRNLSGDTLVWTSFLSGHDRRTLSRNIKIANARVDSLSDKLNKSLEKFAQWESLLDTRIAVLLLGFAGVIGVVIDSIISW